ncbi:hypothetical protein LN042_03510 [Kitasatospora sp. RB6PN24]|uniref:hypothetical protein n=1 Tax=Kitasatospora humi TaxID=2893891 RepID=UPI001E47AFEF|nr:hypothetical protein [Kitasatospora humi]MCC9306183.1 hypothetical protein [Kitasatospora humi]
MFARVVRVPRPGGWLLVEDFDCGYVPVPAAPGEREAALFERVHAAFLDQLRAAGADPPARGGAHRHPGRPQRPADSTRNAISAVTRVNETCGELPWAMLPTISAVGILCSLDGDEWSGPAM